MEKLSKRTLGISMATVRKADSDILKLFPSLNFRSHVLADKIKESCLRNLFVLLATAEGRVTKNQIAMFCQMSYSAVTKSIDVLEAKGLSRKKMGASKKVIHYPTAKGIIALMALPKFWNFKRVSSVLAGKEHKDSDVAFALLIMDLSIRERSEPVYEILKEYAKAGHNLEEVDEKVAADSMLEFLSNKWNHETQTVPEYLSVFKQFTTQSFEGVIRTIMTHMKPRPEDYNSFVQFLCEVANFYRSPVRRAYANILSENAEARLRLDEFKKAQESLARQDQASAEVTFRLRSSSEFSRFSFLPAHLQAVGLRLIVEPTDFMINELKRTFWPN